MSSMAPADDMTHLYYEILGACLSECSAIMRAAVAMPKRNAKTILLNQSRTEMRINAELAFSLKREL